MRKTAQEQRIRGAPSVEMHLVLPLVGGVPPMPHSAKYTCFIGNWRCSQILRLKVDLPEPLYPSIWIFLCFYSSNLDLLISKAKFCLPCAFLCSWLFLKSLWRCVCLSEPVKWLCSCSCDTLCRCLCFDIRIATLYARIIWGNDRNRNSDYECHSRLCCVWLSFYLD